MANTIETVWKLILDEQSADKSDEAIERLAKDAGKLGEELNKISRAKRLDELAKGWGKTAVETGRAVEAAEALNAELKKMAATDDELKSLAKTFSDVATQSDKAAGGKTGGGGAPAAAKFRGAASLLGGSGAGEVIGVIDDIQDAFEGLSAAASAAPGALSAAASALGPVGLGLAAVAAVAALAFAAASESIRKEAQKIDEVSKSRLALAERLAAGLTTEDALAELEANERRRVELTRVLTQAEKDYNDFLASQPDILGNAGDNLLKVFDDREAAGEKAILDAKAAIAAIAADDQTLREAIDQGRTITGKATEAEVKLAEVRGAETTKGIEKAADNEKERARETEKAAAEQQRAAEQFAAKQEQIDQKRYDAAQKYGDALVDIARKSADDATALAKAARQKEIDNRAAALQDISDLSTEFADSEHEEVIKRQEDEAAELRAHARKLEQIRDDAFTEENDFLKKRDFLSATRVRERANTQIEQENKALLEARDEKLRLQKSEDDAQLRELDKARRERMAQLQRANAEAKQQYQRDVENQRAARRINEREAGLTRDRELRQASEMARALLGIRSQAANVQVQLAQNALNTLRGMSGGTTNNNQRTVNGGINFNMQQLPGGGISGQGIRAAVLGVLGEVGLAG
jgi:hypothetical protein